VQVKSLARQPYSAPANSLDGKSIFLTLCKDGEESTDDESEYHEASNDIRKERGESDDADISKTPLVSGKEQV